jgi:hypothetical protein
MKELKEYLTDSMLSDEIKQDIITNANEVAGDE